MQCFIQVKVNLPNFSTGRTGLFLGGKIRFLPLRIFVSYTSQKYKNVTAPYQPSFLHYPSSNRLQAVNNKEKFQTFSSKSGTLTLTRGRRLQEAANIVIFGILKNWSHFQVGSDPLEPSGIQR